MEYEHIVQIGLYAIAVAVILLVMVGLPAVLGERHWNNPARRNDIGTNVPYESGIRPTGSTHIRLPIQYYLVAMFFVIFDLEVVFLYGWAVAVRETGWLGFFEAVIFSGILLAALIYLWRIGGLDWSAQYQRPPSHRRRLASPEQRNELVA